MSPCKRSSFKDARVRIFKSGISGSGSRVFPAKHMHEMTTLRCDALLSVGWLIDGSFVFVKSLQALNKTHASEENTAMRCVAIGWLIDDAVVFSRMETCNYEMFRVDRFPKNDLKETCELTRIYVLMYAHSHSLSRGMKSRNFWSEHWC
jgi:hypothetical protein